MRAGEARVGELQRRMSDEGIDLFIFNDADNITYFAEYWNYLGMEFGRATLLIVPRDDPPILITPAMESEMARAMTWIVDIQEWSDGSGAEWARPVERVLDNSAIHTIAIEPAKTNSQVLDLIRSLCTGKVLKDGSHVVCAMRMIKTAEELVVMRQAGQVAAAMAEGGKSVIAEDVPEYEVALAVIAAGTRKAASLLTDTGQGQFHSPAVYNLQILQSGHHTCMVHRRSNVRRIKHAEPVYLCFCGIANFKNFKLGFDREFFVGEVRDSHARVYETTLKAQQAALAEIRPGAVSEDVNAAAEEVYRSAGFDPSYRTGRSIGYSFLEPPELKRGDKTVLKTGMTFAVDGGITVPGEFGGRVGDSIVVTKNGFDYLTDYPRDLTII